MLKHIAILTLALSVLSGCAAPAAPAQSGESDSVAVRLTDAPPPETVTYQVSTEVREDTVLDGDGTALAHYSYELPVLTVCRADGTAVEDARSPVEEEALAVAAAFNGQFTDWAAEDETRGITDAAREDREFTLAEGLEWTSTYEAELSCVIYRTERMVSVSAEYYSNTGGAHPNTWLLNWNFDLTSGTFFPPEALAEDGQAFQEAVRAELIRQADAAAAERGSLPTAMYWEDYAETIAGWSSYAVSFDEEGMTVGFSPYELACYAAGQQVFTVSYAFLTPYLSDGGRALLGLD